MLGTLLDKLGSLFSKSFVVGSMPLLAFLLLNGLITYRVSHLFQDWIKLSYFSADAEKTALLSFGLLLVVVIVNYVFSSLSVPLREILEGKHFGVFLSNVLSQRFRNRLASLEAKLDEAEKRRQAIRLQENGWKETLSDAYLEGNTKGACSYSGEQKLRHLLDRRSGNQAITAQDLELVVTSIVAVLRANNPELTTVKSSKDLDHDHSALLQLIDYASDKWDARVVELLAERQSDYAGKDVAPTRMGNIANVAPFYAGSRYSMNLELIWTRLQKVLQADPNFYSVLQDAKLQLDFLVELIWLTLTFTLTWVTLLPWLVEGRTLFLVIAIAGPAATYIWYVVALQNYRAFSNLLCASVDLYRLELLNVLHIPLPANGEQERQLWEILERRLGYGEHPNITLHNV